VVSPPYPMRYGLRTVLNLSQKIALNFRLGQRLILTYGKKQSAIGLHAHMQTPHRCHAKEKYRFDYVSDAHSPESHPWLYVLGCPADHYDPLLFRQINQAIEIEDFGGLGSYCGVGESHLPFRVVEFYSEVLAARDRFLAERDAVYRRMQ